MTYRSKTRLVHDTYLFTLFLPFLSPLLDVQKGLLLFVIVEEGSFLYSASLIPAHPCYHYSSILNTAFMSWDPEFLKKFAPEGKQIIIMGN